MWLAYGFSGAWLHLKIALVAILVVYHFWCGRVIKKFTHDEIKQGHVFFRFMNELPVFLLFGIVFLVVLKPQL